MFRVLLTTSFDVKLADLGLSDVRPRDAKPLRSRAGTAAFRAPEVWGGGAVGCAADMFSYACVLVCLVKQRGTPYARGVLREVLERDVPAGTLSPELPETHAWYDVVVACGACDPLERWSSADVVRYFNETRI